MQCKICKIPLIDMSYPVDMFGTKILKEEFYCPNDDIHNDIVENLIKDDPEVCPICNNDSVDYEFYELIKDKNKNFIFTVEFSCNCGFYWKVSSISSDVKVKFDEEKLNDYSEWE